MAGGSLPDDDGSQEASAAQPMTRPRVFSSVSATILAVNQPQAAKSPKFPRLPRVPRVICRVCHARYNNARATLVWHANAFGRSICSCCEWERKQKSVALSLIPVVPLRAR